MDSLDKPEQTDDSARIHIQPVPLHVIRTGTDNQYVGKLNETGWWAVSPWRIIPKENR